MKITVEKQGNDSQSKRESVFKLLRRSGKKGASSRTKDFWRALSATGLSSPQGHILRRLHD